jgi:hypothetical protein
MGAGGDCNARTGVPSNGHFSELGQETFERSRDRVRKIGELCNQFRLIGTISPAAPLGATCAPPSTNRGVNGALPIGLDTIDR